MKTLQYFKLVRPFTEGYAAAKGIQLPYDEETVASKRFIWDNLWSEMGEFLDSDNAQERIDAMVDMTIYMVDYCIRYGLEVSFEGQQRTVLNAYSFQIDFFDTMVLFFDRNTDEKLQSIINLIKSYCITNNYPFASCYREVAQANLSKLQPDGTALLNERGKIIKPEGWVAPDLSKYFDSAAMTECW